jgi:16S rRNA (guanine966-N2)-methyltransferase
MPTKRPERGRDHVRAAVASRPADGFARAPHKVRIIGGRFKRTPLPVANVPGLRPTPDRVRETLFNWLAHLQPDMSRLRGLDLFAGTGALGFELASRGAGQVTLIEREPRLVAQLRALRDKLGAATVEIVQGDALQLVRSLPAASFDLVFIDPPYDMALQASALAAVAPLLAEGALLYVEADKALPAELLATQRLSVLRALRAGKVHAHLLQRRQDDAA